MSSPLLLVPPGFCRNPPAGRGEHQDDHRRGVADSGGQSPADSGHFKTSGRILLVDEPKVTLRVLARLFLTNRLFFFKGRISSCSQVRYCLKSLREQMAARQNNNNKVNNAGIIIGLSDLCSKANAKIYFFCFA